MGLVLGAFWSVLVFCGSCGTGRQNVIVAQVNKPPQKAIRRKYAAIEETWKAEPRISCPHFSLGCGGEGQRWGAGSSREEKVESAGFDSHLISPLVFLSHGNAAPDADVFEPTLLYVCSVLHIWRVILQRQ